MLQSTGSQRVGQDLATEHPHRDVCRSLWIEVKLGLLICIHNLLYIHSRSFHTHSHSSDLKALIAAAKGSTLQTSRFLPLHPTGWQLLTWRRMLCEHPFLHLPNIHSGLSRICSGARPQCSFQNAHNYPDLNPAQKTTLMEPKSL